MTPNITKGTSIAGSIEYLASPVSGHKEARIVGGNLGLEGERLTPEMVEQVTAELRAPHLASGRPQERTWCCSLSIPPSDGTRPDGWWAEVAERAVGAQGFAGKDPVRWVAVHHGPSQGSGNDHVHIALVRARESGKLARDSHDFDKVMGTCRALEREHDLTPGVHESGLGERGYLRGERAIAEKAGRNETTRQYYKRAVRGCMVESRGPDEFAAKMASGGLHVEWRLKGDQRVGYSVVGPDGIPYAGGKIARDLSYPRLLEHWRMGDPETADQAARLAAGKLAAQSLRAEPEGKAGPLARESRDLGRLAQTRSGASLVLPMAAAQLLRGRIQKAERDAQEAEQYLRDIDRGPRYARERDRGADLGL